MDESHSSKLAWWPQCPGGFPSCPGRLHWLTQQVSHSSCHDPRAHPRDSSHAASSLDPLANSARKPGWCSLEDVDIPVNQKALSHAIDQATFDHLLSLVPDTRSKALALSTAISHAGDWLTVVPSRSLGLHLLDREFRTCLQYWLGIPMLEKGIRCPVCQSLADLYGDQQVGCGGNGDRIHQHNSLRDALYSAAQSAALAPRKEVPALIPGTSSQPADVFLLIWKRGQPAALDVTVISTLQNLTVAGAASTQGHALSVARERKMALHSPACHSVGVSFFPLVVESLGGWSDTASIPAFSSFPLEGQCRPLDSPVPDPLPPGRWTGVIVELCVVFCAVFLCCLFYFIIISYCFFIFFNFFKFF